MTLVFICVKIFFARILDVSIATIRQSVMLKGKIFLTTILAFTEVFIWFVVAREALTMDIKSIFIPIFYSLGYATGTLLGAFLSKKLIKGSVGLQIIVNQEDNMLLKALKTRGYEVSIISLENDFKGQKKRMLFLEVNSKSLPKIEKLITKTAPDAFIVACESKKVTNGIVK